MTEPNRNKSLHHFTAEKFRTNCVKLFYPVSVKMFQFSFMPRL